MRRVPRHDSFRLTGQRDTDTTPRLELSVQLQAASSPTTPAARAKFVPDAAATDGVQRGVTGTPIVTPQRILPPAIAGLTTIPAGGGSRIRTLEGVRRRIYRPLPCNLSVVAYSTAPAHPSSPGPHTPMTVGRFRRIGAVCGPSQPTEQHSTMRCDADQRQVLPLVSARLTAVIRRPAWSPRRSCRSERSCQDENASTQPVRSYPARCARSMCQPPRR